MTNRRAQPRSPRSLAYCGCLRSVRMAIRPTGCSRSRTLFPATTSREPLRRLFGREGADAAVDHGDALTLVAAHADRIRNALSQAIEAR